MLRRLPPPAIKEAEDFITFLAARSLAWDYADPSSVKAATDLMATDPFLRRESEAINKEFAITQSDGLEEY